MTSKDLRLIVEPTALAGIGALVPGPKSAVSPVRETLGGPLSDAQRRRLRDLGLVDGHGELVGAAQETFHVLARARTYARVRVLAGPAVVDWVYHLMPAAERSVAVIATQDGLLLRDPAPIDELSLQLRQLTGDSLLRNCAFDVRLRSEEALVLATAIDLQRKATLRAYSGASEPDAYVFEKAAIDELLHGQEEGPFWLAWAVRRVTGEEEPLSQARIASAVSDLSSAGQLVREGPRYRLGAAASTLAASFLTIERVVAFETGVDIGDGRVAKAEFLCLQAGVNDLLYVAHQDRVHLATVSAAFLLRIIEEAIRNPPAAPVAAPATPSCAECGAPLEADQRLCQACGAAVGAPAAGATTGPYCTNCGDLLEPGSKFCTECGTKVE